MELGFIGLGNMASAMIGGILKKQKVKPGNMIGSARTRETLDRTREKYDIHVTLDNREVAARADILFLAVKPYLIREVIEEIRDVVRPGTLVVSVAAGRDLAFLKEAFGREDVKLVRCMPNTPALVLEGCTGVCAGEEVPDEDISKIVELTEAFGKAHVVPEKLMDAVGAVSGSSPAFVFLFIEALADGAVAAGMMRKDAYEFAAQAVLGSAKLVLETGKHPGELKDMVCSPGGTTIQGIKALEEGGLRAAVMNAVEACVEKTRKV